MRPSSSISEVPFMRTHSHAWPAFGQLALFRRLPRSHALAKMMECRIVILIHESQSMNGGQENQHNNDTYRRLKETIGQTYPRGWFVGLADDQIVAAAADFRELEAMLRAQGRDARQVLVVEAGVDYPESATIFI
jgi:hypothetical protein